MGLLVQQFVVGLIVAACLLYAVWILLPRPARRGVAGLLLKLHWPARPRAALQRAALAPTGCGCDDCPSASASASASKRKQSEAAPLRFHPKPPGR